MRERLIDANASNWVDRGQPAGPELTRVLAYYVGQDAKAPDAALRTHVDAIRAWSKPIQPKSILPVTSKRWNRHSASLRNTAAAAERQLSLYGTSPKCAELRDRARRLMEFGTRG